MKNHQRNQGRKWCCDERILWFCIRISKGEKKNVEGKKIWIQYKGSLKDTLVEMQQDLQSSISYAGGKDLESIRKVDYVIVKNSIFNGDTI